jgi:hypothetical protein
MRNWVLGPLVDGGNMMRLAERRERQLVEDRQPTGSSDYGAGSSASHFMAIAEHVSGVKHLVERFPELRERAHEFAASEEFRSMPVLRYPPIFGAALAMMAGRAAKRRDGHDIAHLTRGLSRRDIVTADGGNAALHQPQAHPDRLHTAPLQRRRGPWVCRRGVPRQRTRGTRTLARSIKYSFAKSSSDVSLASRFG